MWLSLLLAALTGVLVGRLGWPSPRPEDCVVGIGDSVAAATPAPRYQVTQGNKNFYRRQSGTHPISDEEETSVSSSSFIDAKRKTVVVELNSADTLTLQMLWGIGPTFARRIVRYRDQLGGFHSVEQLQEVYGMTDDRYQSLVPHLTLVTDSLRRIPVNQATIKELMRHPYVDAYQARDIIRYRDQGHLYRSADDLRLVATMDDSTLNRLLPYLSFE